MASQVDICNLALQKLGASRIASILEDSRNARSCNACYDLMRRRELRTHKWNFATTSVLLAPDVVAPVFNFKYKFALPADCLKPLPPNDNDLDWKIQGRFILTNNSRGSAVLPSSVSAGTPVLALNYIMDVTDTNLMDALFLEAFASRMAYQMVEEITQSTSKKADALAMYKECVAEARKANAFESISDEPPRDIWITAQL